MTLIVGVKGIIFSCHGDIFLQCLVKRFLIMEAIAAIKFKCMPIEDLQQENNGIIYFENKCKKSGYSIAKTNIILNMYMENIRLAKCIQLACWGEWAEIPVEQVNQRAVSLAQAVIDDLSGKTMLLQSIRLYIRRTTNAMFDALELIKSPPAAFELIEPIVNRFSKIDRKELHSVISNINHEANCFIELRST